MGKKNKKRYKGYCEELAKGFVLVDDGKIYYTTVYNYILSLSQEAFCEEVERRVDLYGHYPPLEKVLKKFVLNKFFPQYNRPFSSEYVGRQLHDLEYAMIPVLCDRLFEEARRGAEKPNFIISLYMSCYFVQIAQYKVKHISGKIYHIADPKIIPHYDKDSPDYRAHENARKLITHAITDDATMAADCHCLAAARGFLELLMLWRKVDRADFHRLADWYFKDLKLEKSFKGAECVLNALNDMLALKIDELSDFILELYEEHSSSFNMMMKRYPKFDFIRRGKSERFESIEAFAKKHGESSDFFVEEVNLTSKSSSTSKTRRQINKDRRDEYRRKVLRDMNAIFMEVQEYGTDFHVLNFTQNELKTRAPSKNYVAVAFKHEDKWFILVDSLRLGEGAIFLWKGEYSRGLDVLKQARSFARETPGITHKNHFHKIDNIVKYRAIINEAL